MDGRSTRGAPQARNRPGSKNRRHRGGTYASTWGSRHDRRAAGSRNHGFKRSSGPKGKAGTHLSCAIRVRTPSQRAKRFIVTRNDREAGHG